LEGANRQATGYNPLCGDKITVFLKVENDVVREIRFHGTGCAISTASASLMTERIRGMNPTQAEALFAVFHKLVTGKEITEQDRAQLSKLGAFSGVKEFPIRVKCATLPWHTFRAALQGIPEPASIE